VDELQEAEVLGRGQMVVQRRALDHRADVPEDGDALVVEALAEDPDLAALPAQQAEDQAQGRGLAGAVRAEESVDTPGRNLHADAAEDVVIAEAVGEIGGLETVHGV
jgi:hypothetical protein